MQRRIAFSLLLLLTGCCAVHSGSKLHLLAPGDTVRIEYTCRTPDGALAADSGATATVAGQKLSPLFVPQKAASPVLYTVPAQAAEVAMDPDLPMEEKIERYLLRQAEGKPLGERVELAVEGELFSLTGGDRYLPMRRNSLTKRRVTMPVSAFTLAFSTPPAVGLEEETKVAGLSCRVLSVQEDTVELLYSARPGTKLPSIFGEQTVTQTDEHLAYRTNAREGALVRSNGYLVGKITTVTEDAFVVDYGHPFGFVPLTCQTTYSTATPAPASDQQQATVAGDHFPPLAL